jgi:hypothetical protein
MKRFSLLIVLITYSLAGRSQSDGVMRMTKHYHRSDPFLTSFSDFVAHLTNDPTLKNTRVDKRTDSTRYFFEGSYSLHNPFSFKTDSVRVVLSEREEMLDWHGRLVPLYTYQLIAYAKPGEEGLTSIKKEFKQFKRRYYINFEIEKLHQISDSTNATGEIMEFYKSSFSAFRTAWISTNANENIFVLTLQFSVRDNWAYTPIPARKPKIRQPTEQ